MTILESKFEIFLPKIDHFFGQFSAVSTSKSSFQNLKLQNLNQKLSRLGEKYCKKLSKKWEKGGEKSKDF